MIAYEGTEFTIEWYFDKEKKIIITNAFLKKSQKLPRNAKELALQANADYKKRLKGKIYYEKN